MVRLAGHISVPSGGGAAALRALLQEPEWSDQDCYGLGYVDGPLAGRRRGLGRWAQRLIIAYFKQETRPGFYQDGPCHDPEWIRCIDCNEFFSTRQELSFT